MPPRDPPPASRRPPDARPLAAALVAFAAALAPGAALAGGGPENVLLVVNANSSASKEVANHYVRLRDLPPSNVVYLDYRGDLESIDGAGFREQILGPLLTEITVRELSLQIDTVAYSCDFPWRVRLRDEYPDDLKLDRSRLPVASLTGATYLWRLALIKSPAILSPLTNWYAGSLGPASRQRCVKLDLTPPRAFRSRYAWGRGGGRTKQQGAGLRYLMSTMLGVTTGRGNTVDEVVESLRRAAFADTTPPDGTFFFVKNGDVRSSTRHACYASAAAALRAVGARAEVQDGVLPRGPAKVAGMMLGYATLPLDEAEFEIQPGAICEHLTSSGGSLQKTALQTPITDLIRLGAAGVSGTVEEPLALQAKFPAPSIHLHYRRGSSLAEAFYQSVAAPYQLLILGDPLCQPWARRPRVEVDAWPAAGERLAADALESPMTPRVEPVGGQAGAPWELFIDGRLSMRLPSGAEYTLDPETLGPGWHSLRCVGFDPGPLEFQGRAVTEVVIPLDAAAPDDPPTPPVRLEPLAPVAPWGDRVELRVESAGAERVDVVQNRRVVGGLSGSRGVVRIDSRELGRGPVRLQAIARPSGAASAPVWVAVN